MYNKIVTHTSPDFDAIASAYQLWLVSGKTATIEFVPIGATETVIDPTIAMCDIGGVLNTELYRFDHHGGLHQHSATWIVAEWIEENGLIPDERLQPELVTLIDECDTIRNDTTRLSNSVGIHSLLSEYKNCAPRPSNMEVYLHGCELLERLNSTLRHQAWARGEIAKGHQVGQVLVLIDLPSSVSYAARDMGWDTVVYCNRQAPNTDEVPAVGILTNTERYNVNAWREALYAIPETRDWYYDSRGFYAGRNSQKAEKITRAVSNEVILEIANVVNMNMGDTRHVMMPTTDIEYLIKETEGVRQISGGASYEIIVSNQHGQHANIVADEHFITMDGEEVANYAMPVYRQEALLQLALEKFGGRQ